MSNRSLTLMMGFVAALIVVVGAVLVIALLGNGDDGSAPASPSDGSSGSSGSPAGFCRDSVLITFGADPASVLDPIQVRDEGTAEYVVEIFGGLVTLDLNMKVVPDIAESWDVSPDGLTYTFHLRDDVVFHNGRRVTAEDFKYSFERAADPANASPTVLLYLGNIVGVRERYNNQASEVSGVQVIDERTLQIRVRQPTSYFLAELTYPVA
ncbi:MAG: ABC transporter substrate-binding protein, partial [Dehalococcoidia bacterium]|nr:ABC transporter substrate-binding protein [Dehalococcoidia bacterium]